MIVCIVVVRGRRFVDGERSGRDYLPLYGVEMVRVVVSADAADCQKSALYGALADFRRLQNRAF